MAKTVVALPKSDSALELSFEVESIAISVAWQELGFIVIEQESEDISFWVTT